MTINTNAIHSRKLLLLSNNNRLISLRKSDESCSLFSVSGARFFKKLSFAENAHYKHLRLNKTKEATIFRRLAI